MIILEYSPDALQKIGAIQYYIAEELQNPAAASATVLDLRDRIRILKTSPKLGALLSSRFDNVPQQYADARYFICGQYIIMYLFDGYIVRILRIYHHSEDYVRHLLK
ncbi:MAG: type II toxin-antitoxin system RelE/ParE family toxin [Clostridiales Family XIII bacterium]|nr:type II toxin-antitoxin system RelE/ParE family toxin [Clostridiales Family XIII bacterium]